jgi:tRNA C32,U32 (ribose-2'-O)-methylase TrmJ
LQLLNDYADDKLMKIKESDCLASKNDINQYLIRIENNLKLRNYTSRSKNNIKNNDEENIDNKYYIDNIIFNNNNEVDSIKGIRSIFTKIPITKSECNMLHGMLTALVRPPLDGSGSSSVIGSSNKKDNHVE